MCLRVFLVYLLGLSGSPWQIERRFYSDRSSHRLLCVVDPAQSAQKPKKPGHGCSLTAIDRAFYGVQIGSARPSRPQHRENAERRAPPPAREMQRGEESHL